MSGCDNAQLDLLMDDTDQSDTRLVLLPALAMKELVPMDCRVGCGACCIALSISSSIPGMPDGKPAGVRCVQLTPDNRCLLFGQPERPEVCVRLRPNREMCGETAEHALAILEELERLTAPDLLWLYEPTN
jgi:hypothetical protein